MGKTEMGEKCRRRRTKWSSGPFRTTNAASLSERPEAWFERLDVRPHRDLGQALPLLGQSAEGLTVLLAGRLFGALQHFPRLFQEVFRIMRSLLMIASRVAVCYLILRHLLYSGGRTINAPAGLPF